MFRNRSKFVNQPRSPDLVGKEEVEYSMFGYDFRRYNKLLEYLDELRLEVLGSGNLDLLPSFIETILTIFDNFISLIQTEQKKRKEKLVALGDELLFMLNKFNKRTNTYELSGDDYDTLRKAYFTVHKVKKELGLSIRSRLISDNKGEKSVRLKIKTAFNA